MLQDRTKTAERNSKKKGEGDVKHPSPQSIAAILPDQFQRKFHGPAAAIENVRIQESSCGSNGHIACLKRIGVGVAVQRAVVAGKSDAEVSVIEHIVRRSAELQRIALGELHRLRCGHVPDIEPWRPDGVSPCGGQGALSGLDEDRKSTRLN